MATPYPLAPSRSFGLDGLPLANSGVIKSKGRGQAATPQQLVVVQARLRQDEMSRRKRAAHGLAPSELLAPPTSNVDSFEVRKGEVCLIDSEKNGTMRGSMTSDAGALVSVTTNVAGKPAYELSKLAMVGVVTKGVDMKDGDNRATIVIDGIQTVVNTGMHTIPIGARVIVDPFAATTLQGGELTPAMEVWGRSKGFAPPALRALDCNSIHSWVTQFGERLRVILDDKQVGTEKSAEELRNKLVGLVKDVNLADRLANKMPIRGYLNIWLPWWLANLEWRHLRQTYDAANPPSIKQLAWLLQILRLHLLAVEDEFSNARDNYECALPMNKFKRSAVEFQKIKTQDHTVRSQKLQTDITNQAIADAFAEGPVEGMLHMADLFATLNLFAFHYMAVLRHELGDWIERFALGLSLSTSSKSKPLDVFLGR